MTWRIGDVHHLRSMVDDTQIKIAVIAIDQRENIYTTLKWIYDPILQVYPEEPGLSIFRCTDAATSEYTELDPTGFEEVDVESDMTDEEIVEAVLQEISIQKPYQEDDIN
jgi:hypothetical protein